MHEHEEHWLMGLLKKLARSLNKKSHHKQIAAWERIFGEFDKANYEDYTIREVPNESSGYHGEIIKWAQDIVPSPKKTLLAGEGKSTAKYIHDKIHAKELYTTGLLDVDYRWNFEEDPPHIGQFDLIISQAILEHLLDPYKHMCDLASLLVPGGFLIVHTVVPGFSYHRYPLDTFRFFPDWFEEIAKRLNLSIVNKRIKRTHIFYLYEKL